MEASLVAELNLVPGIMKQLVVMLKESISKLDWMVPQDLYLPAPPLYCPQPARNDGVRLVIAKLFKTRNIFLPCGAKNVALFYKGFYR